MNQGACMAAGTDAGCGSTCHTYITCVDQCPQDGGFNACATSCSPPSAPGYAALKACICTECATLCPAYCM